METCVSSKDDPGLCRLWPESAQVPLTRVTSHERQQRAIPLSIMYQYQSEEQSVSRPYRDPAWASGVCASSVDRCLADASCTGEVHLKPTPCNDTNLAYMLRAPALPIEARWPWSRKSFLAITTARQNVHCHRQYVSDQSATAQHVTHGIAQPSLFLSYNFLNFLIKNMHSTNKKKPQFLGFSNNRRA